jgi:two-component system cell cycle sensor histidine kinase/response regulator CckA
VQTILVVDDEELVLDLVCTVLQSAGYDVLRAAGGPQALALCQGHKGPIHLALLDVMMPGMTGPELRDCLRELLPSVRILYMSGYTHSQIGELGIKADAGDFIGKPFSTAALVHRIQEQLS